jgi:hypothetical protein
VKKVSFVNEFRMVKEHPLGKGEVHSSILCGSTTKTHRIWLFASIAESAFGKYRQNKTRSSPLIVIPTAPSGAIVLEAVKVWPGKAGVCREVGTTANLDSSCARWRERSHGRDEETDFQIEQRN